MKEIKFILVILLLTCSIGSSQQRHEIHSRGMIRQSVFNTGDLGRPCDAGKAGSLLAMPSFEWPSNKGYQIYIKTSPTTTNVYNGYYNSMGGGLWLAGDTAKWTGGTPPRMYNLCGASSDNEGNNQPGDGIGVSVQRIENYPVLSNGTINPAYIPNEAEEKIISIWNTPLGITVTRTSRAWSLPDYDDFIIYEYELENTGRNASHTLPGGATDTIRALTVAYAYTFDPSMVGEMLINTNNWNDLGFRGDKAGALSFNYGRFNWTRWMMYNHTINGLPYKPYDKPDTILTAAGAIGILPLYYDYDHLSTRDEVTVALAANTPESDSLILWDSNRKYKQPYNVSFDNGNLNLAKFKNFLNIEVPRTQLRAPMRTSTDSATYGLFWIGRAKAGWTNTLRNPTGKLYGFGPYTFKPGDKIRFAYAEVAGFGAGTAGDSIYWDMGGGWGTGDHAPSDEPQPGVHPVPSWWNTMSYEYISPPTTGRTKMGSTYMQTRSLPDYVNSNVISIRDVADRAIQMYKGGPLVKYDDTSRYSRTWRDMSKQFDPTPPPLGTAQNTGVYQVPIPCPAPAIFIANTPAASNKLIWGPQVDTISSSTFGFSRLIAPLSYYLIMRGNDPMGPWQVIDSVGRRDPRYYQNSSTIENKGSLLLGDSAYVYLDESTTLGQVFFYAVVSVDSLGGISGKTNIALHTTQTPAVQKLGHVYAAPNPLILNSGEISSSAGGDASNKIYLCGLPKRATIRIFSYAGQLVKTIEHNSVTSDNREGAYSNTWFQITRGEQWAASGVYYFVVEDKDTGDRAWNKFVIIH